MKKTYLFKTNTTMKEYNRDKWYIIPNMIRPLEIEAETVAEALRIYADEIEGRYYVTVSKNALKTKNTMYIDTEKGAQAVGYVITGATDFERDNYGGWSKQFIDLWVEIKEVKNPFTV